MKQYKTLVLNSDFRPLSTWPLSIIPAEDAIHAFFRDRVSIVENWDGAFFHSPSTEIAIPKTVALRHYAPVSAEPKFCRRSIFLRDRFRCQFCGQQFPSHELTFDHLIPRSKGGVTSWTNILTACIACNTRKADQDANHSGRKGKLDKHGMRPLKTPRRPTTAELLRAGMQFLPDEVKESWADYLYWDSELQA